MLIHVGLSLKRNEDVLDLSLSSPFRWILSGLGVALIIMTLLTATESVPLLSRTNALPIAVSAFLLLGAAYHERWRWDTTAQHIEHRFGVGPLVRTRLFPFESVQTLRIAGVLISQQKDNNFRTRIRKPQMDMRRSAVHLSLLNIQSRVFRIDVVKGPRAHTLVMTAKSIAQLTNLPLRDDVRHQQPW